MKTAKVGENSKVVQKYKYNKQGKVAKRITKTKKSGKVLHSNKLTDILHSLPEKDRAPVARTWRKAQSADLAVTTSGTVGTGITGAVSLGRSKATTTPSNTDLSPLVQGGVTTTTNRRDDDEDDFGGVN